MGFLPKLLPDAKLVQKIVKNSLLVIIRLSGFVGKPFFYLILFLIILPGYVYYTTKRLIGSLSGVPIFKETKRLKKSADRLHSKVDGFVAYIRSFTYKKRGVIFIASKNQLRKKADEISKIVRKKIQVSGIAFGKAVKVSKDLSWKTEVFFIALVKFTAKTFVILRALSTRLSFLDKCRVFYLRIKLRIVRFYSHLPRLSFPKISILKVLSVFFALSFGLGFASSLLFWQLILKDLPSPENLTQRDVEVSTKIYDRNGELLYTIFKNENRTPVALSDIPPQVKLATIAIEDAEFYSHPGFSIRGISRATMKNIREGDLAGGSTITQQLVKNAFLTPEKTIIRKVKEITLAIQVELNYSKNEILEMYLNEVAYGGTAYGIQEAAKMYFDKDANQLSLAEAALLAGLPKSPTTFSPFGPNPNLAIDRQKEVLNLMHINGFITGNQKERAVKEGLVFAPNRIPIKAPHFVFYVRENLENKYAKEFVESSGLEVVTTLDHQIQQLAEDVVREEIVKLESLNVSNAAVIVMNPQTGEILAMVGSKDYFDTVSDGNVNVTTAPRQPGSAIKVVTYALALSNGYTPLTIIPDTPVTYEIRGSGPYTPRNYEGGYRGNVTLRSALAESRNIPAVKVLDSLGVENMVEIGQKMGISTWENPKRFGLSLTLGGGEVTPLDLAQVYATVANYGKRPQITSLKKIVDYRGNILHVNNCFEQNNELKPIDVADVSKNNLPPKDNTYWEKITLNQLTEVKASETALLIPPQENTCSQEQVIDPRAAFLITDILKDNAARAPTFGINSFLNIQGHKEVAVKTGTSNNLRDNWTIGYNQNYLVAVWVGNNDNSPMARIASGVTGATPIFNKIMSALLAKEENHDWEIPEGLIQLAVCDRLGSLACMGCSNRMEWFLEESTPQTVCNPEYIRSLPEGWERGLIESGERTESQD